jgi:hypothetical protein
MIKKITILLGLLLVPEIFARATVPLQKFENWQVVRRDGSCFLLGQPSHSKGFAGFREQPYFIFRKDLRDSFQVSIFSGFAFNATQPIKITTYNKSFFLQPYRSSFASTDPIFNPKSFIEALLQDQELLIVAIPGRNNLVAYDYYDIRNLGQILNFLQNSC